MCYFLGGLDRPVVCLNGALVIGSRLDADAAAKSCRIAFYGRLCHINHVVAAAGGGGEWRNLSEVQLVKDKVRRGTVDRITDGEGDKVFGVIVKVAHTLFAALLPCGALHHARLACLSLPSRPFACRACLKRRRICRCSSGGR